MGRKRSVTGQTVSEANELEGLCEWKIRRMGTGVESQRITTSKANSGKAKEVVRDQRGRNQSSKHNERERSEVQSMLAKLWKCQ